MRLLFFQDARRKGAVPLPLTSVSTTLQLSGDVLARLPMLQRCSVAEQLLRAVRAGAADADVRGLDCFLCFEFHGQLIYVFDFNYLLTWQD